MAINSPPCYVFIILVIRFFGKYINWVENVLDLLFRDQARFQ